MADPTFIRSKLGDILPLAITQLAMVTGVAASRIIVTAIPFEDVAHFVGEVDILIGTGSESPMDPRRGGGRHVNERDRTLKVAARARCYLDEAQSDLVRLTRESLGLLALEDAITDALESFQPEDASRNVLSEPFLVGDWSEARRGQHSQPKARAGWVFSWCPVRVRYVRALDQSRS